jgi:alkylhydroperoxidase/carboxymuconolactone decarboxylase family protein YurZ
LFQQPANLHYGGLVDSVRFAQEGNRNNCLLWAARSMCEDGATEEEAYELLVPAAMEAGQTEKESRDTIRSAYRLQGSRA